mgnify:CR=1 FL=1
MNLHPNILFADEVINRSDLTDKFDITFTNGVFDLLHIGHIDSLKKGKEKNTKLVVGLNSNYSVYKLDKGPNRPIQDHFQRAITLISLECVDYVVIFNEVNPIDLIKRIKPENYFKGGDYNIHDLMEAEILKSWGGKTKIIPTTEFFSTSNLLSNYNSKKKRAFFFDRDGIINKDTGYIDSIDRFELYPEIYPLLETSKSHGFLNIIITNQSGIARGRFSIDQYNQLNEHMLNLVNAKSKLIDDTFFCPHHEEGLIQEYSIRCTCRKPNPGMIFSASMKYNISLKNSFLIGDKISDVISGRDAGIKNLFLLDKAKEYDNFIFEDDNIKFYRSSDMNMIFNAASSALSAS